MAVYNRCALMGASPLCRGTLGEFTRLAQRRHSKAMVAARTPKTLQLLLGTVPRGRTSKLEGGCQSSGLRAGAAGVEGRVTTRNEIMSLRAGLGSNEIAGFLRTELGDVLLAFRVAAPRAADGYCWAHSTCGHWLSSELYEG